MISMRFFAGILLAAGLLPSAEPSAAQIKDLAFIAGAWQGKLGPMSIDEVWMAPGDGVMTGMFRMARGGKVSLLEFMTLDQDAQGIVLRLRHFNQALHAREDKTAPREFRLVDLQGQSAKFATEEPGGIHVTLVYRAVPGGLEVDFEKTGTPKPERVTFVFRQSNTTHK